MKIFTIPLGPVQSNMYLVEAQDTFFIIDPSCPVDSVRGEVSERFSDKGPSLIFITHAHFDHMYCMEEWKAQYPECRLYMSPADVHLLKDADSNCSSMTFRGRAFPDVTEDIMKLSGTFLAGDSENGICCEIYPTPGHTSGSCSILLEEKVGGVCSDRALFTGDSLFCGSVGRCDFETGNEREMAGSIAFFKTLPKDLKVYPGHGPATDIGTEIRYNPFF